MSVSTSASLAAPDPRPAVLSGLALAALLYVCLAPAQGAHTVQLHSATATGAKTVTHTQASVVPSARVARYAAPVMVEDDRRQSQLTTPSREPTAEPMAQTPAASTSGWSPLMLLLVAPVAALLAKLPQASKPSNGSVLEPLVLSAPPVVHAMASLTAIDFDQEEEEDAEEEGEMDTSVLVDDDEIEFVESNMALFNEAPTQLWDWDEEDDETELEYSEALQVQKVPLERRPPIIKEYVQSRPEYPGSVTHLDSKLFEGGYSHLDFLVAGNLDLWEGFLEQCISERGLFVKYADEEQTKVIAQMHHNPKVRGGKEALREVGAAVLKDFVARPYSFSDDERGSVYVWSTVAMKVKGARLAGNSDGWERA